MTIVLFKKFIDKKYHVFNSLSIFYIRFKKRSLKLKYCYYKKRLYIEVYKINGNFKSGKIITLF